MKIVASIFTTWVIVRVFVMAFPLLSMRFCFIINVLFNNFHKSLFNDANWCAVILIHFCFVFSTSWPYPLINSGTGKGQSVLDVIGAFEKASGKEIQYKIAPRRPGDLSTVFADSQKVESFPSPLISHHFPHLICWLFFWLHYFTKAERELNWRAEKTIDDMCQDSWRWISKNPDGYMPTSSSSEPK